MNKIISKCILSTEESDYEIDGIGNSFDIKYFYNGKYARCAIPVELVYFKNNQYKINVSATIKKNISNINAYKIYLAKQIRLVVI